jgi:hypothetical protein
VAGNSSPGFRLAWLELGLERKRVQYERAGKYGTHSQGKYPRYVILTHTSPPDSQQLVAGSTLQVQSRLAGLTREGNKKSVNPLSLPLRQLRRHEVAQTLPRRIAFG